MTAGGRAARAWPLYALAAVDAVLVVGALVLGHLAEVDIGFDLENVFPNIVFGVTLPWLGALVLSRAPGNRLGALYVATGTATALTIAFNVAAMHGDDHPDALTASPVLAWLAAWIWSCGAPVLITLGIAWFPDGRPVTPRWRWIDAGTALFVVVTVLSMGLRPGPLDAPRIMRDNPVGIDGLTAFADAAQGVAFVFFCVSAVGALVSLGVRYHRSVRDQRLQIRGLLVAVSLLIAAVASPQEASLAVVSDSVAWLAIPLIPLSLAVAILRHRLFGIEVVVRRSLTYGLLSAFLLAVYVGVVALGRSLFDDGADTGASLVAAALVALLLAPVRARLQRSVDELVYGRRGDPYAAMTELGRRLGAAGTADDALSDLVTGVAEALRAPYVAILLRDETAATAEHGRPTSALHEVPLEFRGEAVGRLLVAQRTTKDAYSARDLALLEGLGPQVAVAAHAVLLTRDLQRSRERLVTAREEERRRIRRDLHDGLGPALAGVAFGIDAVRNRLNGRGGELDQPLAALKDEVQSCLADVRRLVYDLRPPALDQLGLVAALEQFAARLREGGGPTVVVHAPPLPTLPAAVEVAAYRIATEALTNTTRHAGAAWADVRVSLEPYGLRVEVTDDGSGLGQPTPGVGLTAMAERAEELGGRCTVAERAEGGVVVSAWLPLRTAP